jgi:hypothetical protein
MWLPLQAIVTAGPYINVYLFMEGPWWKRGQMFLFDLETINLIPRCR